MQDEIEIPAQPLPKVLLVGTLEEARAVGARRRGGRLMTPSGRLVMTVNQGPRAFEGLQVSDWAATELALRYPQADRVVATLQWIVARSTSNTLESKCECGYPDGSFACRIRHVQMNTGAAKAARD